MRGFLLALGFAGSSFFAGLLVLSYVNPLAIEQAAREVVRIEVEKRVGTTIDRLSDSRIAEVARKALGKANADIEASERALRADLPAKIANVISDMLRTNCECRKRLAERLTAAESSHLASLVHVRENLTSLIESAYSSVRANLLRELRIFTASNAIAFAILVVVTWYRKAATLQLLLPALVLVGAVAVTGGFYLFSQDWLHTIVFGDYVGLGYSVYLAAVASLFADVSFNRARITTMLINGLLHSVGSALVLVPC